MAAEPIPSGGASLRVDASVDHCADVRRFVRKAAAAAGLTGQALDDLICASDEAVTNAIVHGYRRGPGWVAVEVSSTGDSVAVTVTDAAPWFDPTGVPPPDLDVPFDQRRPGGMGVHLMRQLTDEFSYRSRPGAGNEITLAKRRPVQGEREDPMETRTERVDGDAAILALTGELDASNFESLIEEVRGLYAGGVRRLILDLEGLSYMASSGLVALHAITRILRGEEPPDQEAGWAAFHALGHDVSAGGREANVRLVAPQPSVARILERTGLKDYFAIHPDRAAAIAAL